MSRITTITPAEFIAGQIYRRPRGYTRHTYKATMEGRSIIVRDQHGLRVPCQFAGTQDNRTLYAWIEGVGYIGGWQYPHKSQPWAALAVSINRGRLYASIDSLPKSSKPRKCPHCGGEL